MCGLGHGERHVFTVTLCISFYNIRLSLHGVSDREPMGGNIMIIKLVNIGLVSLVFTIKVMHSLWLKYTTDACVLLYLFSTFIYSLNRLIFK